MERWRRDEAMALFDDALVHRILPESLQRPVLTKTGYGNYLTGVMPFFGPKFRVRRRVLSTGGCIADDRAHFFDSLYDIATLLRLLLPLFPVIFAKQVTVHEVVEAGHKMAVHVCPYLPSPYLSQE